MKEGKDTSEWTVTKWVLLFSGIATTLGTGLSAMVAGLVGSGALASGETLTLVLGTIGVVLAALGTAAGSVVGKAYVDGRSAIKAASEGK